MIFNSMLSVLMNYAGKRKISSLVIVAIVAPIALSLLLLAISYYFLSGRERKKHNSLPDENGKSLN